MPDSDRKNGDSNPNEPTVDATAEGSRARADGVARENCPYPPGSEQCEEWLEGYDGGLEPATPPEGNGGNPPATDGSRGT
jgi:hypothetical protein